MGKESKKKTNDLTVSDIETRMFNIISKCILKVYGVCLRDNSKEIMTSSLSLNEK